MTGGCGEGSWPGGPTLQRGAEHWPQEERRCSGDGFYFYSSRTGTQGLSRVPSPAKSLSHIPSHTRVTSPVMSLSHNSEPHLRPPPKPRPQQRHNECGNVSPVSGAGMSLSNKMLLPASVTTGDDDCFTA